LGLATSSNVVIRLPSTLAVWPIQKSHPSDTASGSLHSFRSVRKWAEHLTGTKLQPACNQSALDQYPEMLRKNSISAALTSFGLLLDPVIGSVDDQLTF
jgi:hypothetical protein